MDGCQRPFHDHQPQRRRAARPHRRDSRHRRRQRWTGFIARAESGRTLFCHQHIDSPQCSLTPKKPDVMGYHDAREIPNYWSYARHFVLQDHMFQPDTSWSLPSHLFMVSGWSARCSRRGNPMSCVNAKQAPGSPPGDRENLTGAAARLRLDRSHVPPAQAPRELAVLRRSRASQPDCDDNADALQGDPAERQDAGNLEPAAVVRHRAAGPPARRTSPASTTSHGGAHRDAAGGVVAHARAGGQRPSAGAHHARARPT